MAAPELSIAAAPLLTVRTGNERIPVLLNGQPAQLPSSLLVGPAGPAGAAGSAATPITATGSDTPRTLANRFADAYSVEDWRVDGVGVTRNDSATLQAAIDAAIAGDFEIKMTLAEYVLSATINVTGPLRLLGRGKALTIVRPNTADIDVLFDITGNDPVFDGFTITGKDSAGVRRAAKLIDVHASTAGGNNRGFQGTDLRLRDAEVNLDMRSGGEKVCLTGLDSWGASVACIRWLGPNYGGTIHAGYFFTAETDADGLIISKMPPSVEFPAPVEPEGIYIGGGTEIFALHGHPLFIDSGLLIRMESGLLQGNGGVYLFRDATHAVSDVILKGVWIANYPDSTFPAIYAEGCPFIVESCDIVEQRSIVGATAVVVKNSGTAVPYWRSLNNTHWLFKASGIYTDADVFYSIEAGVVNGTIVGSAIGNSISPTRFIKEADDTCQTIVAYGDVSRIIPDANQSARSSYIELKGHNPTIDTWNRVKTTNVIHRRHSTNNYSVYAASSLNGGGGFWVSHPTIEQFEGIHFVRGATSSDRYALARINGSDRFRWTLSEFLPELDNTYELGNATKRWLRASLFQVQLFANYTIGGATPPPDPTGLAGRVIRVSNGNAGAPCLAMAEGGSWLRIPLGAAISAT